MLCRWQHLVRSCKRECGYGTFQTGLARVNLFFHTRHDRSGIMYRPADLATRNMHLKNEVLSFRDQTTIQHMVDKEHWTPEVAEGVFRDTLQFLFVCGIHEQRCAPTPAIDVGWHHFILHTRAYTKFCKNYFGRYIHHNPGVPKEQTLPVVEHTIELARAEFGVLSENWDLASTMCRACDSKCDGCDKDGP